MTSASARCQCGRTAIEIVGAPILSAICYCNSCRMAGSQFELAPGAPAVIRSDGGTPYCLYRKDRARIAFGGEHLHEHRLTPESPTRRIVATCCNTPMFLDFTKGHWLTLYRDRMPDYVPRLDVRIMTKDAPAGVRFADDIPTYPKYPPIFLIKLLAAWAVMGFRRPRIAW